jgi:uncharacterized protein YyaL (SSP411 family)
MIIRRKRTRPLLDDKVLLGRNALQNTAYSKAYAALGNSLYREAAVRNIKDVIVRKKELYDGAILLVMQLWLPTVET